MFIQRVSVYPALGKDSELRDTLTEWIKKRQSQGMNVRLGLGAAPAVKPVR